MTSSDFGITVSCYRGDLPLLKGCLASIRENLPACLPICLIAHGAFPTSELEKLYRVTVLDEGQVDPKLRAASYGYGVTKMIAFWHSPFRWFLHIDSDAVCWGDFTQGLPWAEFDLIYNEPHEIITNHIQTTQYFDPEMIFPALPAFPWQGQPFFNTGVFTARRGIFDLDEYLGLLRFQERHPQSFLCGDQGILNYLAFRHITAGRLHVRSWPFQAVVPVVRHEELAARFTFANGRPVIRERDRRLIHWAGPKPYLIERHPYVEPMVHYRLEHLRRSRSKWRFLGRVALAFEELNARITRRHGGSYARAAMSKVRWWASRVGRRGRLKR